VKKNLIGLCSVGTIPSDSHHGYNELQTIKFKKTPKPAIDDSEELDSFT